MDSSIAIFGRQQQIGLAELESLYGPSKVIPIGRQQQAALIQIAPCSIDYSRLGGTVKLCKVLTEVQTTEWKSVEKFLINVSPGQAAKMRDGKMHLGLSAYGFPVGCPQLLATGLRIKKAIQNDHGRSVRLVPNKQTELNAAQVIHNQLLGPNGWELIIILDGTKTYIAQTVAVQDIDGYGRRDFGRPKRDARIGMLPPKLAQILINLAIGPHEFEGIEPQLSGGICLPDEDYEKLRAQRSHATILDPFCGSGVVLQEAVLMGYNAYGTDISSRMIDYSRNNLTWLSEQYATPHSSTRLEVGDATMKKWQPPIDAVASEAYLGRPFTTQPPMEILAQTISECNLIIKKFLVNIHQQLKPGTRLAIAIPAWQYSPGKFRFLPLIDQLPDLGYNLVHLRRVKASELLYFREDQLVARQLLLITRM